MNYLPMIDCQNDMNAVSANVSIHARLLFSWLRTNMHCHNAPAGLYRYPLSQIAFDIRFTLEETRAALAELAANNFIVYDYDLLFIPCIPGERRFETYDKRRSQFSYISAAIKKYQLTRSDDSTPQRVVPNRAWEAFYSFHWRVISDFLEHRAHTADRVQKYRKISIEKEDSDDDSDGGGSWSDNYVAKAGKQPLNGATEHEYNDYFSAEKPPAGNQPSSVHSSDLSFIPITDFPSFSSKSDVCTRSSMALHYAQESVYTHKFVCIHSVLCVLYTLLYKIYFFIRRRAPFLSFLEGCGKPSFCQKNFSLAALVPVGSSGGLPHRRNFPFRFNFRFFHFSGHSALAMP